MRTTTTQTIPTLLLFCLLSLPAYAGWFGTTGSGHKIDDRRDVKGFSSIDLKSSIDVRVHQGSGFNVVVHIDDNLAPLILTTVEGDTLVINTKPHENINSMGKSYVDVTMPALKAFQIHGSGDADISGFSGSDLAFEIQGSGDIDFRGSANSMSVSVAGSGDVKLTGGGAQRLAVEVDGSGDVKAGEFTVHDADARVNGSGDVDLSIHGGALNAAVNGSGDITWRGDGRLASSVKRGSGDIAHR